MKSIKLPAGLLLVLFLSFAAPIFAQSDNGNIRGTITDPNGAVVPNARVILTSQETGQTRETTSSDQGTYTFPEVKAGVYRVAVEAQGFQRTTTEDIKVAVQATHSVNIQLQLGANTAQVTVEGKVRPSTPILLCDKRT